MYNQRFFSRRNALIGTYFLHRIFLSEEHLRGISSRDWVINKTKNPIRKYEMKVSLSEFLGASPLFGFKSLTRFERSVMKAELRNEVLHIPGLTNHLRACTRAHARQSIQGHRYRVFGFLRIQKFLMLSRSIIEKRKRKRERELSNYCDSSHDRNAWCRDDINRRWTKRMKAIKPQKWRRVQRPPTRCNTLSQADYYPYLRVIWIILKLSAATRPLSHSEINLVDLSNLQDEDKAF